jgi:hypothetical protein
MFSKIVLASLLTATHAACPNKCSGHGTCSSSGSQTHDQDNDKCTCFKRREGHIKGAGQTASQRLVAAWTGYDCSMRTCPYGYSFASNPGGDFAFNAAGTDRAVQDGHDWKECSNAGTCDRKTGMCNCFDGYAGAGCERTACPNDCSGHGSCESQKQFFTDAQEYYAETMSLAQFSATTGETVKYTAAWDAEIHMGCKCDPGFRGPDCSIIECPSGTDPLSGQGSSYGRDCSGRGKCDTTSGICTCFSGFYGDFCQSTTALY